MEILLNLLRAERDRAVREFLALEGWACSKIKVQAAVNEMVNGTRLSTSSLAWLLMQIRNIPVQAQPARRLNDLTQAIAACREAAMPRELGLPTR
ncbi:MAG TPA: hypothetical protein VHO24_05365 [Opitutaceae bacterium]|nr:hypothetical protein [Opitutaceae bacterium]